MNKDELKIFFRLKKEELTKFLISFIKIITVVIAIIVGIYLGFFLCGLFANAIGFVVDTHSSCSESYMCQTMTNGSFMAIILIVIGICVLGIYKFVEWIRDNIRRAKLEAAENKEKQ